MDEGSERRALIILFLVVVIDMIGFGIIIPFMTFLVEGLISTEDAHLTGMWVGLLMAAYSLAQFLMTPVWGGLSDRVGRRPIILIGLVGNTLSFALFGIAWTLSVALLARFFAGAFNANIAVARAYIGDVSDPSKLTARMGLIGVAFGLGFAIGPFIGGELSDPASRWPDLFSANMWQQYPYLLPCLVASALSLISLGFGIFNLPESLPPADRTDDIARNPIEMLGNSFRSVVRVMRMPTVGSLVLVSFCFMIGFTVMHAVFILQTMMPVEQGGYSMNEADNGRLFALLGVCGIIVQGGLVGKMSKTLGSRRMMPLGLFFCGFGLVLIPQFPAHFAWPGMIIACIFIAFGNGTYQPAQASILTRSARASGSDLGIVMGAQEAAGSLARIIGPLLGGVVWSLTSTNGGIFDHKTAFWVCGVFVLFALVLQAPLRLMDERTFTAEAE